MKKAMRLLMMVFKPFLNERGAVGDPPPEPITIQLDENGFIPGTSYKTWDEFAKGHGELKTKLDSQGNELGQLRGQAQTLAESLKEALTKGAATPPATPPADGDKAAEYETKAAGIQAEIEKLDPMDDKFSSKQAKLISDLTKFTAMAQHEKTLGAAKGFFKEELTKRDTGAAQQKFLDANPSYNTPEMQTRIKEFMATDRTGMHDPMSAFFALQAADIAQTNIATAQENAELKKLLELKKGEEKVGKVYVPGQPPGPPPPPKDRLTGKDADAGAYAALSKLRSEG